MRKYDSKYVEEQINSLTKFGYIVKLIRSNEEGDYYYKIQHFKNESNDIGMGIGYKANSKDGDYFYHNSHGRNDADPGNVWNHSNQGQPGPSGWYTFDQKYVENLIISKRNTPIKKVYYIEEQVPSLITNKYRVEAESEEEALKMVDTLNATPYDSNHESVWDGSILEYNIEVIKVEK